MFPNHLRHRAKPEVPARASRRDRGRRGQGGALARLLSYAVMLSLSLFAASVLLPGLPSQYNILATFDPEEPHTPLTRFKLARATATPEQCLAVLDRIKDARYARLLDREVSESCHIRGHVQIRGLSRATLAPVSTSCETALRLYMWERKHLQPAAERVFGTAVSRLDHASSFSCRRVRTERGEGGDMSAHATASAIDISGVVLANGRQLDLKTGWRDPDAEVRRFWRAARDGACKWFGTVLGPEYNSLHADHFHLGEDRYSVCR